MANSFQARLVSPRFDLGGFSANLIEIPTVQGYIAVGADHAALLSQISTGVVRISTDQKEEVRLFVSEGTLHIEDDVCTLMASTFEKPEEIDLSRAESAQRRAVERLEAAKNAGPESVDIPRALAALERAKARQQLHKTKG